LAPVKGEYTHGHAMGDTKQVIDLGIVGSYPADPGEAGKSGEEIGREEVYDNNQSGCEGKKLSETKEADCRIYSQQRHM
jgi:hypothetical protein